MNLGKVSYFTFKRIFKTRSVNAFIQETDNLKPLTTETKGFVYL